MSIRTLVTGGGGFIGSHLVRGLLQHGHKVRVLDNFATGRRSNLAAIAAQIEIMEGDLRDLAACRAASKDVDLVFHLGALGSVPRSIEDPLTTNAVNVEGTLNILITARDAGAGRLVFSSSSSVYGDTPTLPKHEQMPLRPRSPYAVSKLTGEEYCRVFTATYGFETVCLRYFNVFGPRQDPNSQYAAVIPRFLAAVQAGDTPDIHGDGQQSRDFTYVSNVVQANILAGTAPDVAGEVFNIACGEQITVVRVLQDIAAAMAKPFAPRYLPARAGDIRHSRATIEKAQERLHFAPTVLFAEGLSQTVAAFLQEQSAAHELAPA